MFQFSAYDLRRRPTVQERVLWNYLRARRLLGLKFRRQHPLGPFIVDFACLSHMIIIEVDGPIHEGQKDYDRERDLWLRSQGFHVIRIKNHELDHDRDKTLLRLRAMLLPRVLSFRGRSR